MLTNEYKCVIMSNEYICIQTKKKDSKSKADPMIPKS